MEIRNFQPETDASELIRLYQTCFAEAPWYEEFFGGQVMLDFGQILNYKKSVFLVAVENNQILGAAAGYPIINKPDVAKLVQEDDTFYLAELFVRQDARRKGIAKQLVRERFRQAAFQGFYYAYVRTSIDQPAIIDLYQGYFWFKEVARQEVVSLKKIADKHYEHTPDNRVILRGHIPEPRRDPSYRGKKTAWCRVKHRWEV